MVNVMSKEAMAGAGEPMASFGMTLTYNDAVADRKTEFLHKIREPLGSKELWLYKVTYITEL